jgi:hypothetical protein
MIMAEGANPRIGSRIVTAGALAGSIEDAGDVAPPVAFAAPRHDDRKLCVITALPM